MPGGKQSVSERLKSEPGKIVDRVEKILAAQKEKDREIEKLKSQMLTKQASSILDEVRDIAGVKVLAAVIDEKDPKALRSYGDRIRDQLGSGIIIFGAHAGDKAQLLVMVTKDLTDRFSAGDIIKQIAPVVGGRGGGRNDMAQAGGKEPEKLQEALDKAVQMIAG